MLCGRCVPLANLYRGFNMEVVNTIINIIAIGGCIKFYVNLLIYTIAIKFWEKIFLYIEKCFIPLVGGWVSLRTEVLEDITTEKIFVNYKSFLYTFV